MKRLKEMTVLLVDDDEAIRISMEYFFRKKTLSFKTFETAELALEFLSEHGPIDIIIADYRLPRMDGVSFLRIIKEKWPTALTVMVSAYSDPKLLAQAKKLAINRLVPKPFKAATILDALNRMTQPHSAN